MRSTGDGALDRLLADGDRGVRRRAALAAGRIGDASMAGALVARMNDTEPEVRQMSAFALGLLGDPLAAERLVAALTDADRSCGLARWKRSAASAARARRPPSSRPFAPRCRRTRRSSPSRRRPGQRADPWLLPRLGLFALVRLKDVAAAESVLLADGRPRFDWWAATWAAMRLENAALKPVLLAALRSSDPVSRALGARGLGALKDAGALDAVAPLLRTRTRRWRSRPCAPWARWATRAPFRSSRRLKGPSAVAKSEALGALALLPPDRSLRPSVVAFVGDPDPAVRGAALRALSRLDREEFALVLSGLDPDPERSVRAARAAAAARRATRSARASSPPC